MHGTESNNRGSDNLMVVSFKSLPIGAKFTYLSSSKVMVVIERHGTGLVAEYSEALDYAAQGVFSAADSDEEVEALQVLHVKDAPSFQTRVKPWLLECFGPEIANDKVERNHRFLEEALELVQSTGCTASEAHQLVDYVFNRPVGEPEQETGGVMVTLAALCLANEMDMHACGETELARISVPEIVLKIRAKQAAKPKHSPLPQHVESSGR